MHLFLLILLVIKFIIVEADIMLSGVPPREGKDGNYRTKTKGKSFILAQTLLNGSLQELRQVPKDFVLESITGLEKLQLDLSRKLILWDIIKDDRSPAMLNLRDIQQIRSLIRYIPEIDLFQFNVSDWKIVEYLGTYPLLGRRQTGILGYSIKQRWGNDIMSNLNIIKKMKGLICGFSLQDLQSIPYPVFSQLDHNVFKHIKSCTERQLQVMINKAKKSPVHGPPQSWKVETCRNLSKLIKALSTKDLETIKPVAMAGIDSETIEEMSLEQLLVFSNDQVNKMNSETLSKYRKITGIIYNNSKNLVCPTLLTLIVYKVSLHILK